MGKYQSYPDYKKASVTWLDEMPEHWILSKVKYIAPFQVGWTPPTKNDENFVGENLWVNISDLKKKVITNTSKRISDKAAKEASMSITPKGSLMYSFKLSVGTVSFAGEDMYTNEAIASFLDSARLPLSYLYYALPKFVIENASTNIYGARILNQELINNAQLLEPTFEEAENIANFLDHETAKIDILIEKQQQLIKLLKEKRQAVISHAVTKGLNPQTPMKDSGVEWLGEVPSNWDVINMHYVLNAIGDVDHYMPQSVDKGIPYVMTGDLTEFASNISFEQCKQVSKKDYLKLSNKIKSAKGDVIMARYATIGTVSYIDIDRDFLVSYSCVTIKPNPLKVLGLYLYYYFKSHAFLEGIQSQINTNTQGNVGVNDLKKIKVTLPSLTEQAEIIEYLQTAMNKLDMLVSKSKNTIRLSKERRTALISAAVTGKIDVRNWEQPND
ncbi:restriction endonuclease subunit S [Pseudoalteromonas nigrifaciens]|uniref:restriction endonuclease subunit S n=1 Tax=Pseudoalteromonas nigrifaciens TaxID=28109 RepID=UPI0017879854|nr:restriction endonuclease subunit S [Pseudoalteromonas nigrifaciens]MBE0421756.1 restriction endonuclease subunit S [Pseudoalteromonas nigrifaciens]